MPWHSAQRIIEEALSDWEDVPDFDLFLTESEPEPELPAPSPPAFDAD